MPFDEKTLDRALARPDAVSLSVVATTLVSAADLAPTRRRDLASALRRVAAALDRPLDDVPADPEWLRPRLARIAPAALGLSPKTWTNILSDLRAALDHVGAATTPPMRISRAALSPAWAALRDSLPTRRHRIGLGRFMRFCSNLAVSPDAVDDALLGDFRDTLARSELRKDPDTLVREIATLWNQAAGRVPGWPRTTLTPRDRRNLVALPKERFPASLDQDVEAYLARLAVSDLCDPDAPARPLAPATIAQRRRQLWRLASALVHRGRDPEAIRSLADLVEPKAAREALRFALDRRGARPSSSLYNKVALLKSVAKWHVRADAETLDALSALGRKVAPSGSGLTPKNRARLRPFDEDGAIVALLRLPDRLVAMAGRARNPAEAARAVEMALAISLLLHCPMRIENLRRLHVDRHLLGRRGESRRIVIPADEVKNLVELDFPLTPQVARLLDRFLETHRKALNPTPAGYVFAKRSAAEPVGGGQLGQAISRTIRRETGLEVNPHLFRHIGAKIVLRANPGAYEVVRRLLGHSLTSSTIDCYAGFETDAATRSYAAILEGAQQARPRRGRRRGQ